MGFIAPNIRPDRFDDCGSQNSSFKNGTALTISPEPCMMIQKCADQTEI